MERIIRIALPVAQWYERLAWHWLPLVAQLGMAFALLLPLRGGMIPDFADKYGIDIVLVKAAWMIAFLAGACVLYVRRNSGAFMIGSAPLVFYVSIGYGGYSLSLNNYIPFSVGFCLVSLILKIFVHMQNGRIRHE